MTPHHYWTRGQRPFTRTELLCWSFSLPHNHPNRFSRLDRMHKNCLCWTFHCTPFLRRSSLPSNKTWHWWRPCATEQHRGRFSRFASVNERCEPTNQSTHVYARCMISLTFVLCDSALPYLTLIPDLAMREGGQRKSMNWWRNKVLKVAHSVGFYKICLISAGQVDFRAQRGTFLYRN